MRHQVFVGPPARRALAEAGTAAIADRSAERPPHLLDPIDEARRRARQRRVRLHLVLDEMSVSLGDDQAGREEVDLAIRGQRRHEIDDALVCLVDPLDDLVGGSRLALLGRTRVLSIDIHEKASPSVEPVRQLQREVLHPIRDVAEHRLVGPSGGRRLGECGESETVDRAAEWTPGLAHLREDLGGPLRDRRVDLVEMLGVVAIRVSGYDRDDPVVLRVDQLPR